MTDKELAMWRAFWLDTIEVLAIEDEIDRERREHIAAFNAREEARREREERRRAAIVARFNLQNIERNDDKLLH